MPRANIQAGTMLIDALLLHELLKRKKKGKEHGLRNGFLEEICICIKHLVERIG
jgi:hypothetical protein